MVFCYSCMNQLQAPAEVCPHCKSKIPYIPLHKEDLQPGTRLNDGRFVIGRALGHGGYGITYIAYDTKMLVRRTIKEYFPKGAHRNDQLVPVYPESEEANVSRTREHFLHEARMMIRASESHIPGVVQGIDTFKENGTSYILMEYLEGYTLDDYMHQVLYGPFKWDAAVRYVVEALDALQKLHEKNILHRDISCNNIFLCKDNSIRLIDFGSAEPLDKAQTDPGSLWKSRKPAYTPREQAENRKQGAYSDVYAMGVVLFKMITGNVDRNLNGKMLPSVRAVSNNQEIPQALDHILMEATVEDPEKRIQTAEEFRRKLLPLIGEKEKKGGRKGLIAILVALVLVFGAILAIVLSGNKPDNTEDEWSTISFSESVDENLSVRYGETFTLSGRSEPGQEVQMILHRDGSENQMNVGSVNADSRGQWEISFDTGETGVELNKTAGFTGTVIYTESEKHPTRSEPFRLVVDRSLVPLTIGLENTLSSVMEVTVGEKVTVTGEGEDDQPIIVAAARKNGSAVASWTTQCQDGKWSYEIDTNELKPENRELSTEIVVTAYYEGFRLDTQTDDEIKLTVRRVLQPITIAFEDNQDTITVSSADKVVTVHGTAEANETINLRIGKSGQQIKNVPVNEDGTWEAVLPKTEDLQDYEYNARVEMSIYASYSIDSKTTSESIILISNVLAGEKEILPVIENIPSYVEEGEDFTLSGTAEAGAVLKVSVLKRGQRQNLADGLMITVNEEGRWSLTINTNRIADERKEGSTSRYSITVYQEKEEKELTSRSASLSIYCPVHYDTPTIRFADQEGSEKSLNYNEGLELTGTAKSGEHLRLLINGDAIQADINAGSNGVWNYSFSNMNAWKPALNEEKVLVFRIKYAGNDITDEKPVSVTVTNESFKSLSIKFDRGRKTMMIGSSGSAELTVKGEAGKQFDLLRNGIVWKSDKLDGTGYFKITLTTDDIVYGSESTVFQARYTQQAENLSGQVTLQADQIAEAIRVNETVTEETAEISGTAEPGASLTITVDGTEAGQQTAGNDGSFRFAGLKLTAGSKIVISEKDPYGNTATWDTSAAEVMRENITVNGHTNGEFLTYGPDNQELTLKGTAAKNKTIRITMDYSSASRNQPITVTADKSGNWQAKLTLPLKDKADVTIELQYDDNRGGNILIYAQCDNSIAAPEIQPKEIYQRTPDMVTCTVSEVNCSLRWQLSSSGGRVKKHGSVEMDGKQAEITLPTERSAGDVLTITVTDPYGNQASAEAVILEQRDEVSGVITSVVYGADYKDLQNGGEFSDSLRIEAYVAAGSDANPGTPTLQLVQNGNTLASIRLNQASTDEEMQRVAGKLSGHQADQGWRIKNGELSASGLAPGRCELRLTAGNTILETWTLTYSQASQEQAGATHYEDEADGYDAGIDLPASAFNPRGIYITGWLYLYYEDVEKSINSAQLTIYEDAACSSKVSSLNSKKIDKRQRRPGTTKAGSTAHTLGDAAYQKAGWIITFQSGKISSGQYWATLDAGGMTFGPFKLEIDNDIKQVKANDFINSLSWITEE